MINDKLLSPRSIVVVGGSDDISKPGGKVLKNIIDGGFSGKLYVTNPGNDMIQGIVSYRDPRNLPDVDLAIIAIAARFCPDIVELLAMKKGTRAFIILSAGFGEESKEGAGYEKRIVDTVNSVDGVLIGPNCIGVLTPSYNGIFTLPVPKLESRGVDLISGSGATAVFIMESAIPNGISFSSLFSVGNSAQTSVEDLLEYLDETYTEGESSRVKLLYFETIKKPGKLLKHARSLISKGCSIAAIKAGSSAAGSRAASSHTGALANPDMAVSALLSKAGIIRCYSREELASVASVLLHPRPEGRNIAIVTHAGGPAVMLTDALSEVQIDVPPIKGKEADALLGKLFAGSSVANPIDFLATGNAEQMDHILDACETKFDNIDAVAVIFGSSGLFSVEEVYDVIDRRIRSGKKPVYTILPSLITAGDAVRNFLDKGRHNFPDEVVFAKALGKVLNNRVFPAEEDSPVMGDKARIRKIIENSEGEYLDPGDVSSILDAAGIPRVPEYVASSEDQLEGIIEKSGFPLVMKVVGPLHKSDVGGVVLDVRSIEEVQMQFNRMMKIMDTRAVLIQPMKSGTELFAGAKKEGDFGHLVMCGLGGIFIEVIRDISVRLAPVGIAEASWMIDSLKGRKLLDGLRGREGVDTGSFSDIIARLSWLVMVAPEISEMDLNPLLGTPEGLVAVDARIRINKGEK